MTAVVSNPPFDGIRRPVIGVPIFNPVEVKVSSNTKKKYPELFTADNDDLNEPILRPNPHRFTLFPIQYEEIYEAYKRIEASFWTTGEIDLSKDIRDWSKLTKEERRFLSYVLAFFAGSDGIVNENLASRFYNEIQIPEARQFFAMQIAQEAIHSETYSLLIDAYIKDPVERNHLFKSIETIPSIKRKAEWAKKWIENKDVPFRYRLFAFAIVEGIFFSSSFCAIHWVCQKGLLPGLKFTNDLISRDEEMHKDFAGILMRHLVTQPDADILYDMIEEAMEIEHAFIDDALEIDLVGMNADAMKDYTEYKADRLLVEWGLEPLYETKNPFTWMDRLGMMGKTNFFEKRAENYSVAVSKGAIVNGQEMEPTDPFAGLTNVMKLNDPPPKLKALVNANSNVTNAISSLIVDQLTKPLV